jgi:hypothetical protein
MRSAVRVLAAALLAAWLLPVTAESLDSPVIGARGDFPYSPKGW